MYRNLRSDAVLRCGPASSSGPVALIYFDHNASSPVLPAARTAWLDACNRFTGNPSSPHRLGARADASLTGAREKLAGWLGCSPTQIVWTSGATESNNTILQHLALTRTGTAWVSAIEHPSVLAAAQRWFAGRLRLIPVTRHGVVDMAWLQRELAAAEQASDLPALVAVMAANNETGVLQPWRELAARCRALAVPYFCDAAQWLGKMHPAGLGQCDFVSGCGHKFGGPQGVGFLKSSEPLHALLLGGPQEEGARAGTENVAGILAMIAALEERHQTLGFRPAPEGAGEIDTGTDTGTEHLSKPGGGTVGAGQGPLNPSAMRAAFEAALLQELPGCEILGASVDRLWNTVSVIMPEIDCRQRWVVKLDKLGVAVSTGSACASGKEKVSHVLEAMGVTQGAAARVLRLSSSPETSAADWQALFVALLRAREELAADAAKGALEELPPQA